MARQNDKDPVEEASEESFPASDPPSWSLGTHATEPSATTAERSASMEFPGRQQASGVGSLMRALRRSVSRRSGDVFLWGGLATAATSLGLLAAGKKDAGRLVGTWAPTILLIGIYDKLSRLGKLDPESLH